MVDEIILYSAGIYTADLATVNVAGAGGQRSAAIISLDVLWDSELAGDGRLSERSNDVVGAGRQQQLEQMVVVLCERLATTHASRVIIVGKLLSDCSGNELDSLCRMLSRQAISVRVVGGDEDGGTEIKSRGPSRYGAER